MIGFDLDKILRPGTVELIREAVDRREKLDSVEGVQDI